MNTLDELVYYCNESVSTGALMLNGEWGCGKTHLIEKELKEALKDTHFLARISLFGVGSIEALNRLVRKEWLAACIPGLNAIEKHEDAIRRGKNFVEQSLGVASSFMPVLRSFKEAAALSDSIYDIIPIQNKIKTPKGEREFILVFDDLERTKLNVTDVLGCINEFCENQKFKAIIIANEDVIIRNAGQAAMRPMLMGGGEGRATTAMSSLPYLEIKEKIICRTVRCRPDYQAILHSILTDEALFDEEYRRFLLDNEQLIYCIFDAKRRNVSDEKADPDAPKKPVVHRSRNLRSLKCALKDFSRIYQCLLLGKTENLSIYLYNFIIFMMAYRSASIKADSDEATINETLTQLYPMYDHRYMLQAEKKWILEGDWDEKDFGKEEELLKESEKAVDPKDRLRLNTITDIDDEDILKGYAGLLEDCYAGKLTLNEYVIFIKNASDIRYYGIDVPAEIDWDRVMKGIGIRFKSNIESQYEEDYIYQSIPEKSRKHYTKQELAAYDLISGFRTRNTVVFEGSRQLYLHELEKNSLRAFAVCENRRFNCFDEEMANATANCYLSVNQASKSRFALWFKGCWGKLTSNNPDLDSEKTVAGLQALKARLEAVYADYQKQKRNVSAKHTDSFLQTVNEMIEGLHKKRSRL